MNERLPFTSGLPLIPQERPGFGRTLEHALRELMRAPEDRRTYRRNRFYYRPGTPAHKQLDDRIMGELEK